MTHNSHSKITIFSSANSPSSSSSRTTPSRKLTSANSHKASSTQSNIQNPQASQQRYIHNIETLQQYLPERHQFGTPVVSEPHNEPMRVEKERRGAHHGNKNQRKTQEMAFLQTDLSVDHDDGVLTVAWRGEKIPFANLLKQDEQQDFLPQRYENDENGLPVKKELQVIIYWDVENMGPDAFHLAPRDYVKMLIRFGQKFGAVLSLKVFANEHIERTEKWLHQIPTKAMELYFTPFSFKNSERSDNAMITDMMLQTGKIGCMRPGDVFILVSMDADFAVSNQALTKMGYHVVTLAYTHFRCKFPLFDSSSEFFTIADTDIYRVPTRDLYILLLDQFMKRKKMEPRFLEKFGKKKYGNKRKREEKEEKPFKKSKRARRSKESTTVQEIIDLTDN
eukprot:CAMPEP_0117455448 /NCGR_PEP_ID=MMETSP0759-20121206/11367_1 /TAXON_ID=63605 /ORGANISM="Percolomonas cosmopolitus, Strain WS" /LENGTH=392 /DNA_ID=CAMNT_0005248757 /DNA_START=6 /DNA_END=1185 /DNA_ORIENTATION=+